MVQVEAFTCGTPVIASDLPGVRQPVLTSGMGKIVPLKNPDALAEAIVETLDSGLVVPQEAIQDIARYYSPEAVAEAYDALFKEVTENVG